MAKAGPIDDSLLTPQHNRPVSGNKEEILTSKPESSKSDERQIDRAKLMFEKQKILQEKLKNELKMSEEKALQLKHAQENERSQRIKETREKDRARCASAAERRRQIEESRRSTLNDSSKRPSILATGTNNERMMTSFITTPRASSTSVSPGSKQYAFGSSTPRGLTFLGIRQESAPPTRCSSGERPFIPRNKKNRDVMTTSMYIEFTSKNTAASKKPPSAKTSKTRGLIDKKSDATCSMYVENRKKSHDSPIDSVLLSPTFPNTSDLPTKIEFDKLENTLQPENELFVSQRKQEEPTVAVLSLEEATVILPSQAENSNKPKVMSADEAKTALAERRRLAREQQEREKEAERQKIEAIRLAEEEEFRRQEEEELRILRNAKKQEDLRLQQAMEDHERQKIEEEQKRIEELQKQSENELRSKELNEKLEREKKDKKRQDELDRIERKKKLENIRRRTRMGNGENLNNGTSTTTSFFQNGTLSAEKDLSATLDDTVNNNGKDPLLDNIMMSVMNLENVQKEDPILSNLDEKEENVKLKFENDKINANDSLGKIIIAQKDDENIVLLSTTAVSDMVSPKNEPAKGAFVEAKTPDLMNF